MLKFKIMSTIRKNLSRKKQKGSGKQEIMFRLSLARDKVFRFKTLLYVDARFWDAKKEKVIVPRMHTKKQVELVALQKQIDDLSGSIMEQCIKQPLNKISTVWLESIVHIFHFGTPRVVEEYIEDEEDASDFFNLLDTFIAVRVKTELREHQFKCLIRMLKRYELYRGKRYKLTLDEMTDVDLTRFEEFLRIEHTFFDEKGKCIKNARIYKKVPETRIPKPRGSNAINNIMKRFCTFYNWAVKTGRTTNNPFNRYQMPTCVYGTPFYLTKEERNKLFEYDFSANPKLAIQRDIFVFQSCIGIRTGDFYRLTKDNVVGDTIEYIANKTMSKRGTTVSVPLIEQAQEILERCKDDNRKELLPFISTQHYNKAIKEMLKEAGIDRIVTVLNPTTRQNEQHPIYEVASSYMARRNFIGALYKKVKDPNLIGCMTGHIDGSKAFSRYRAIDDDMKKSVIAELK